MIASRMAVGLWVLLFVALVVTALAGFNASWVLLVLLAVYIVLFQLGARIRKR